MANINLEEAVDFIIRSFASNKNKYDLDYFSNLISEVCLLIESFSYSADNIDFIVNLNINDILNKININITCEDKFSVDDKEKLIVLKSIIIKLQDITSTTSINLEKDLIISILSKIENKIKDTPKLPYIPYFRKSIMDKPVFKKVATLSNNNYNSTIINKINNQNSQITINSQINQIDKTNVNLNNNSNLSKNFQNIRSNNINQSSLLSIQSRDISETSIQISNQTSIHFENVFKHIEDILESNTNVILNLDQESLVLITVKNKEDSYLRNIIGLSNALGDLIKKKLKIKFNEYNKDKLSDYLLKNNFTIMSNIDNSSITLMFFCKKLEIIKKLFDNNYFDLDVLRRHPSIPLYQRICLYYFTCIDKINNPIVITEEKEDIDYNKIFKSTTIFIYTKCSYSYISNFNQVKISELDTNALNSKYNKDDCLFYYKL